MLRPALGVSIGWIGISMVSDGVPALLLPHQMLSAGRTDASLLGLTTLVAIALAALLQPIAGHWSDRLGRFPIIGIGAAACVAGLALLASPGTALVGTIAALAGVSVAQAGHQALLPDRIGPSWRGRAGGLKSAFDVAGAFAGFVILAAFLGSGQPMSAVAILAVALVAGFGLSRLMLGKRTQVTVGSISWSETYRLDLDRDRPLMLLIAARVLFLLGIFVVGRFLLLFVAQRFELGADAASGEAGAVLALLALITVVASLPSGWLADRAGRRPLMVAGGVLGATGIALLPAASSLEMVLAFGSLMALGSAAFGSASWAMLADLTDVPDAGRLLGIANLGTAGAAALAGAFGVLIDAGGFGPAFGLAALCSLVGGILAWRLSEVHGPGPSSVLQER